MSSTRRQIEGNRGAPKFSAILHANYASGSVSGCRVCLVSLSRCNVLAGALTAQARAARSGSLYDAFCRGLSRRGGVALSDSTLAETDQQSSLAVISLLHQFVRIAIISPLICSNWPPDAIEARSEPNRESSANTNNNNNNTGDVQIAAARAGRGAFSRSISLRAG